MTTTIELSSLEAVLAYSCQDVLDRFVDEFDIPMEEANDIFLETKKWLWLNATIKHRAAPTRLFINTDLLILDEMWHTFLLFTKEYTAFCQEHFGGYLHHKPSTKPEKEEMKRRMAIDPQGVLAEHENRVQAQYECIYDHLGYETLHKWHLHYPEKYSAEALKKLKKATL